MRLFPTEVACEASTAHSPHDVTAMIFPGLSNLQRAYTAFPLPLLYPRFFQIREIRQKQRLLVVFPEGQYHNFPQVGKTKPCCVPLLASAYSFHPIWQNCIKILRVHRLFPEPFRGRDLSKEAVSTVNKEMLFHTTKSS